MRIRISKPIAISGAILAVTAGIVTAGGAPAAAVVGGAPAAAAVDGSCKDGGKVRPVARFVPDLLYRCQGGEGLDVICWKPGELSGSGSNVWYRVVVVKVLVPTGWIHESQTNGVKGARLC